jgi:hypothetical protein
VTEPVVEIGLYRAGAEVDDYGGVIIDSDSGEVVGVRFGL